METKELICPLCGKHNIDKDLVSYYLPFNYKQILEVVTAPVENCPETATEVRTVPLICGELGRNFKMSLYPGPASSENKMMRIVFEIKVEKLAVPLTTVDQTILILERIKVIMLTSFLYHFKKKLNTAIAPKGHSEIDPGGYALKKANAALKPFFQVIRSYRQIGHFEKPKWKK